MPENELGKRAKQKEPSDDWKLGFRSLRTVNYGRDLLERAKASAKIDRKQECPFGNGGNPDNRRAAEKTPLKPVDVTPKTVTHPPVVQQAEPVLTTEKVTPPDTPSSEAPITPVQPSTEPASVPCLPEKQLPDVNEVFCSQKNRLSNVRSLIQSFEYSKRPKAELPETTSSVEAKHQNSMESTRKTEEHHAVANDEPFLFRIVPESYPIRKIFNDQPKIESSVERVKFEVVQFSGEDFIRPPEGPGSDESMTDSSDEETDSEDDTELTYVDQPATPLDEPENMSFVGSAPMSEDECIDNWDVTQASEETEYAPEDSLQQIDSASSPTGCSPNSKINEADDHPNVLYVRVVQPDSQLRSEIDTMKASMEAAESILKICRESRDQRSSEEKNGSVTSESSVTEARHLAEKYQEDTVVSESSIGNTSPSTDNVNESDEIHELKERSEDNSAFSNFDEFDRKDDSLVSSDEHPQMSSDVSEESEKTVNEEEYHYQVELLLHQIKKESTRMLPQSVEKEPENFEAENESSEVIHHDHNHAVDYLCPKNVTESPIKSSQLSENTEDKSEKSQHSDLNVDDFSKVSNGFEVDYPQEYSIDLPSSDKVLKSTSPDESIEENDDESRNCSKKDRSAQKSVAEMPENIVEESNEEDFTFLKFREVLDEFDENIEKLYGTIQESRLSDNQENHLHEELNFSAKAELSDPNAQSPTACSEESADRQSNSSSKDENTSPISASSVYLAPALHLNTKQMFATSRTPESEELEDELTASDDSESSETASMDSLPEWNDSEYSTPPRKLGIQLDTQVEENSVKEACEEGREARFAAMGFIPLADYSEDSDTSLDSSEDCEEMSDEVPTLAEDIKEESKQIAEPKSTQQDSGDNVQLEIQRRLEESLAKPRTTFEVAPIVEQRFHKILNPEDDTQSKLQRGMTTKLDIRRKHFEPVHQVPSLGKTSEQKLPATKKLYVYKSSSSKVPVLPADIFKERPSSEEWESYCEDDSKSEQPADYYQAPISESPTLPTFECSDEYKENQDMDGHYQSSNCQSLDVYCEDNPEYSHEDLWLMTADLLDCVKQENVFDGCLENDGKSRFYFLVAKIYNQGFGEKLLMSCLPTILARVFNDNDICYFGPDAKGKHNQMRALKLVIESQTSSMNASRPEHMRADLTAFYQDLARVDILNSINRIANIKTFSDEHKTLLVDAVLRIEHYQAHMLVLACQCAPTNVSLEEAEFSQQDYFVDNFQQYDPMLSDLQTVDYGYQDEPMTMNIASECFIPTLLVSGRYKCAPVEWMRQPTEYINEETSLSRPNSAVHHVSMEPVEQETYAAQSSEAEYFIQNNNMLYQTYLEKQRMDQSIETTHTHPIEESLFLYRSGCRDQHGIPTMVMNASVDYSNTSTVLENWSHFQSYCAVNRGFGNNSGPTYFLNVSMPNHQTGGAVSF